MAGLIPSGVRDLAFVGIVIATVVFIFGRLRPVDDSPPILDGEVNRIPGIESSLASVKADADAQACENVAGQILLLEADLLIAKSVLRAKERVISALTEQIVRLKSDLLNEQTENVPPKGCEDSQACEASRDSDLKDAVETLRLENARLRQALDERNAPEDGPWGEACERDVRKHVDMIARLRARTNELKATFFEKMTPSWIGPMGILGGFIFATIRQYLYARYARAAKRERLARKGTSSESDGAPEGSKSWKKAAALRQLFAEVRRPSDANNVADAVSLPIKGLDGVTEEAASDLSSQAAVAASHWKTAKGGGETVSCVNWTKDRVAQALKIGDTLVLPDVSQVTVGFSKPASDHATSLDLNVFVQMFYARSEEAIDGADRICQEHSDVQASVVALTRVPPDVDRIYVGMRVIHPRNGVKADDCRSVHVGVADGTSMHMICRLPLVGEEADVRNVFVPLRLARMGSGRWKVEAVAAAFTTDLKSSDAEKSIVGFLDGCMRDLG